MGKSLKALGDEVKVDGNIIKGCQSKVWLTTDTEGDKVIFKADSDAILVKGLVFMLIRVLSNQKPDDIINADLSFMKEIGLDQMLSMTRSNGLAAMIKQMKMYAIAYKAKLAV